MMFTEIISLSVCLPSYIATNRIKKQRSEFKGLGWKVIVSYSIGKGILHIYGTPSYISMFTRAQHWALLCASLIVFTILKKLFLQD